MGRGGDIFQLFHTYKFYRNAHYRNGGYDDAKVQMKFSFVQ